MKRKPLRRPAKNQPKHSRQRLDLRISIGLDAFLDLPEGALNLKEQTVLKRIQDIHSGKQGGRLTEVDYRNMKRIAAKHHVKLP